jgi:pSer/pThr/pTyr-binding forkhead associated (FHA) protein
VHWLVPKTILGRGERCEVRVQDESVSRAHAEILVGGMDGNLLVDLGSLNGTFVNGVRVSTRTLAHGDLLRVGKSIFRYLDGSCPQ